ncbi:Intraflagellar transport protein 46 -like protein [Halotydeus destructor]|nr:Intraflagellar transport protein 46 -like protein [Halotydeus destructor]
MAQTLQKIPSLNHDIEEDEEEEEEEEDDGEEKHERIEGGYNPEEFKNLSEDHEINQLFTYITAYTPQIVDLDFKLKPFIPEFIPTVGDIDAFIKVPRPDGQDDGLGLLVLDEPSSKNQSDASLLGLRLRAFAKEVPVDYENKVKVKTADSSKDIDAWIDNIRVLHQDSGGAPIQVQRLPDIDKLMQEWDPEFEDLLNSVQLPPPDIDCDLQDYASIICNILDIPVHGSKIASLHQLFTLYNEFKSSQHFKRLIDTDAE